MTKTAMNKLKGWSIGVGTVVVFGTVALLTSAKTSERAINSDIWTTPVIQRNDTSMFEYPTVLDCYIITGIPTEEVLNAIDNGTTIEGYEFDFKK